MPPPTRDLRGELIDNRFRVEGKLGDGGTGSVWAAQHVHSLQRFALKTLHDDFVGDATVLARFLREARAAGNLRTKHVVRIIDARVDYLHDGRPLPFVVMEYLEGATLEQALRGRGPLNRGQALWVANQLGYALRICHENGIVHRDLKPANVFLTVDDENRPIVKLCDFGIAKLLRTAPFPPDGATQTGAVMGTPMYMAPEQLRAAKDGGPEIDQWALGLIVFRMLAGFEYFGRAATGAGLMVSILSEPLPPPSKLSPALAAAFDTWFLRSCHRDAAARWPDTLSQIEALSIALGRPPPEPLGPSVLGLAPPELGAAHGASRVAASGRRSLVRKWNWMIGFATLGILGAMWRMRTYAEEHQETLGENDAGIAAEPASARPAWLDLHPVQPSEAVTTNAPNAPATEPLASNPRQTGAAEGGRPRGNGPARPARPLVSVAPTATPSAPAARRRTGASCSRSSECASGLCVAETCQ